MKYFIQSKWLKLKKKKEIVITLPNAGKGYNETGSLINH